MYFKSLFVLAIVLFLCSSLLKASVNSNLPLGKVINIAGKNRFHSQRIGKAYIMLASGFKTEAIQKELDISIGLIDENIKLLGENAPNNKIKEDLMLAVNLWKIYRKIVTSPPSQEGVALLLSGNTQFLEACNQVVASLVDYADNVKAVSQSYSNRELAQCINLSGKFRMLSQRLAMYSAAYLEEHTADNKYIVATFAEINSNVSILLSSSVNNSKVDEGLYNVIQVWKEIREHQQLLLEKKKSSNEMCEWSNRMLVSAEKLTESYSDLLN